MQTAVCVVWCKVVRLEEGKLQSLLQMHELVAAKVASTVSGPNACMSVDGLHYIECRERTTCRGVDKEGWPSGKHSQT